MTTAAERPRRTTDDLTPEEREQLERAHGRLRDGVKASELSERDAAVVAAALRSVLDLG